MINRSHRTLGLGPASSRLWPVAAVAVAASLALAGCGSSDDSTTSASTSSTSSATTSAASGSVVALAEAFAATLDDDQKTALDQEYTFANATNWSNLPNALVAGGGGMGGGGMPGGDTTTTSTSSSSSTSSGGRVGVQTSTLSDDQWTALRALLQAATGTATNEGYDEVLQHLAADDYLADNGGGSDYGRGNYFIAFLGTPSDTGTWELQFGGHHLAVANTYTDGVLAGATPSFRGIEPFTTVTEDDVTVMPEQQEAAAFAAVIGSLTDAEKTAAELSESFNDIVLGPGEDWAFPTTAEGVKGSDLTADQEALVLAAITTYVGDVDDADAATILATYEGQLDDTYVSYTGTGNFTDQGDYIRIDGPQVWIEFSMQNGIVLSGAHPHAVWRDEKTDYAGLTS